MYNQYADEKIHSFEHEQRRRQAEMQQMAKLIESNKPSIWAQLRSILQGGRTHRATSVHLGEAPPSHQRP